MSPLIIVIIVIIVLPTAIGFVLGVMSYVWAIFHWLFRTRTWREGRL